jgi:ADP-ribose pyrophosphatase YjhB (NUDIX family)
MAGVYDGCGRLPRVAARRARVLAYVTREREGRTELLVFDQLGDPAAGTQVPAGRLDPGESLEGGLLRELHEESGLERVRIVRELPTLGDWVAGSEYDNHAFEVRVEGDEPPDAWEHAVHGDGDDAGLLFLFRWVAVEPGLELWNGADLTYTQLA